MRHDRRRAAAVPRGTTRHRPRRDCGAASADAAVPAPASPARCPRLSCCTATSGHPGLDGVGHGARLAGRALPQRRQRPFWVRLQRPGAVRLRPARHRHAPRRAASIPGRLRDHHQAVRPGDLLFFKTESDGASHVAIAIDGMTFVHAPNSRGVVRVERLSAAYWSAAAARRAPHRIAVGRHGRGAGFGRRCRLLAGARQRVGDGRPLDLLQHGRIRALRSAAGPAVRRHPSAPG